MDEKPRYYKLSRRHLQNMLDAAADQAATQAAALVIFEVKKWFKEAAKDALKEFLFFVWKPMLLFLIFFLLWVWYKLKDYL